MSDVLDDVLKDVSRPTMLTVHYLVEMARKHSTTGSPHPLQLRLDVTPPALNGIGMDQLAMLIDGGELLLVDDDLMMVAFMLKGVVHGSPV